MRVMHCRLHNDHAEDDRCWGAYDDDDACDGEYDWCRDHWVPSDFRRVYRVEVVVDQNGARVAPMHRSSGLNEFPGPHVVHTYHYPEEVRVLSRAESPEMADAVAAQIVGWYEP